MPRDTTIPAQSVQEDILSVEHHVGRFVRVLIGRGSTVDGVFRFDVGQVFDVIDIRDIPAVQGDLGVVLAPEIPDYSELMSSAPTWAPNKPAGTFRNADLWIFVDRIRSRRTQQ